MEQAAQMETGDQGIVDEPVAVAGGVAAAAIPGVIYPDEDVTRLAEAVAQSVADAQQNEAEAEPPAEGAETGVDMGGDACVDTAAVDVVVADAQAPEEPAPIFAIITAPMDFGAALGMIKQGAKMCRTLWFVGDTDLPRFYVQLVPGAVQVDAVTPGATHINGVNSNLYCASENEFRPPQIGVFIDGVRQNALDLLDEDYLADDWQVFNEPM